MKRIRMINVIVNHVMNKWMSYISLYVKHPCQTIKSRLSTFEQEEYSM